MARSNYGNSLWEDLRLPPVILEAVNKAKLRDYGEVLLSSNMELVRKLKLSEEHCRILSSAVSKVVVKQRPLKVSELLMDCELPEDWPSDYKKLSTGCDYLDKCLRGGILLQRVTEIAGESGSGKTQFCLQLALVAQLPRRRGGLNAGTAYICTEDQFPDKRFWPMAISFRERHPNYPKNATDNVHIIHVSDIDSMKVCLLKKLPTLFSTKKVGLVIVDSVAALYRSDYDQAQSLQRALDIQWLGECLHQLCATYGTTVVAVNQVTANMSNNSLSNEYSTVVPSLGLSWSNLVTTRLVLSRTEQCLPSQTSKDCRVFRPIIRKLEVVFAPNLPNTVCAFIVDENGIKGLQP